MSPVNYIEQTRAAFPDQPPYRWTECDTPILTPIDKELSDCKVVIISSGGVYHKKQEAFISEKNDMTFREIDKTKSLSEMNVSHDNYDHTSVKKDVNSVFPIERFFELEKEGFIKELSEINFTFMGRIFKKTQFLNEMIPHLIDRLKELKIDIAFLVPV